MRTAFALIVIGSLAFAALSRDLIAELTGRPFLGISPVQAQSLKLDAEVSTPNFTGISRLEAHAFNGQIRVTVGGQPKLTITRRGHVEVKTERRGDAFVIAGRPLTHNCWRCSLEVEATIPAGLELALETSNGAITVEGAVRSLTANTSNSAITVRDSGASKLKLETSDAPIEVRGARGEVEANTSNGRIRLEHVEAQVRAETSNSDIVLDGVTLPAHSSNTVTTSNGSIEVVALDAPGGARLEGSTSNGGLNLQMPGFDLHQDKTEFTATREGASQAELMLETSNGGITVRP